MQRSGDESQSFQKIQVYKLYWQVPQGREHFLQAVTL